MKEFKIRCSAIGKIMTNARKKDEILGATSKSYCKTWLKEQIYDRRKEFSSKYTEKGLIMEDNSIDFVAEQLGLGMLLKNEKHLDNDYMTGTPDVILKDMIIDVKNSWDFSTFPLFDEEIPDKDYYWQAQGYMNLTGKPTYKLIYTLMDTPIHLIEREMNRYKWDNGLDEVDQDLYDKFVEKMTYPNIEDKYKIKVFDIERNQEDINKINERVIACREFINQLKY